MPAYTTPPTEEDILQLAEAALSALPPRLSRHMAGVAILVEWIDAGEDLGRLVGSVLVHEVAHHFGFSDAEIERIEADMLGR